MNKLTKIKSKSVVLKTKDVDTDQIIPARFLTTTSKKGLGKHLFHDWRYNEDGTDNPNFILNKKENKSSKIADIFKGNSLKNGLLPIVVTEDILSMLMDIPCPYLSICIEKSELTLPNNEIFEYEIDEFSKYCLIEGIDQLGYIKRNINLIEKFEENRSWTP